MCPYLNPYRERADQFPGRLFNQLRSIEELEKFRAVRDNGKDIYVELGSGSGTHLIEHGRRFSGANLFGFELRYKRSVRTMEKALEQGVDNIFLLRTHSQFLGELFNPISIKGIWVNFPDPWEKPTRQKHRILATRQIVVIAQSLTVGGFISFKTDHCEYFESTLRLIQEIPTLKISTVVRDLHNSPDCSEHNVVTEFESLFRSKKISVHHLVAERISDPQ